LAGAARAARALGRADLLARAAHGLDRMPCDVNWLETIGALGEACAMLGDADRAAQLYGLLLPYEGRLEAVAGRALASWGAVDRHLGVMAAAMSRWEDAERHLEAALRENQRLGFRPWLASTRYTICLEIVRTPASRATASSSGQSGEGATLICGRALTRVQRATRPRISAVYAWL
jgi:tetratricopeptide (TPR) repeat protein